jgi:hypothetical protein
MREIRISSLLRTSFRDELERIVFFNPEQGLVTGRLVDLVHRYGVPEIVDETGCLRFRLSALGMLQTLYALDGTDAAEEAEHLVGVAMFTRLRRTSIVVVHIAVHEDYTSRGKWRGEAVVAQLITAIRTLASRTRGVKTLRILYPHEIRFELERQPLDGQT